MGSALKHTQQCALLLSTAMYARLIPQMVFTPLIARIIPFHLFLVKVLTFASLILPICLQERSNHTVLFAELQSEGANHCLWARKASILCSVGQVYY